MPFDGGIAASGKQKSEGNVILESRDNEEVKQQLTSARDAFAWVQAGGHVDPSVHTSAYAMSNVECRMASGSVLSAQVLANWISIEAPFPTAVGSDTAAELENAADVLCH
jgi:hypothetical protein